MIVTPMPFAMQHLRHGLAEAAVADDDRAGLRRQLGPVEPVAAAHLAPLEPVGQAHQERRRRHRDRDDRAEQRAASGTISRAAVACANRTKPNSPAWLSSSPSRKLRVQLQPKARLSSVIRIVLVAITPAAMPRRAAAARR